MSYRPPAPVLIRPSRTASQRWFVFCRLCYPPTGPAFDGWPGRFAGHAKRPGEAADLGREHLRTRHPSGARPGLSPDSGRVQ